jgi:putative DNA primase/helicase
VVILDSISTLVRSGIENEAESWAPIQDWLMQHRWDGRAIILIHHEGKGGKPRGSSKREDVLDTMIRLKKDDQFTGDESLFQLTFTKARDFCGDDAAPMLIRLATDNGQVTWSHQKARDAQAEKILEMYKTGSKGKEIAKEVDLSRGRVSQIIRQLRETGMLPKCDEEAGAGAD